MYDLNLLECILASGNKGKKWVWLSGNKKFFKSWFLIDSSYGLFYYFLYIHFDVI